MYWLSSWPLEANALVRVRISHEDPSAPFEHGTSGGVDRGSLTSQRFVGRNGDPECAHFLGGDDRSNIAPKIGAGLSGYPASVISGESAGKGERWRRLSKRRKQWTQAYGGTCIPFA